ncbi:MAG: PilZ domain-containing protein [Treponema sp.]|nr:PilZ domain-containing protein [Treponema sp.]
MSDEEKKENPSSMEGSKIFFLYPTNSIQSQIIDELIQQEYEAYTAKDHGRLSYALKKYPTSVIFINIDERIPEPEWEKWIANHMKNIPTLKFGIFSSSTNDEIKDKYLNKLKITCGFIMLKHDMSYIINKILETIEASNVKGRRKYLRATAEGDSKSTMNLPFNDVYINGNIIDISVVGISCKLERDVDLKKNSLYKDIQIRLQSTLIKVDVIILGSHENNGEKMYVMLFTQRTDPETRVKIRKYIQQNLQGKMDAEIN